MFYPPPPKKKKKKKKKEEQQRRRKQHTHTHSEPACDINKNSGECFGGFRKSGEVPQASPWRSSSGSPGSTFPEALARVAEVFFSAWMCVCVCVCWYGTFLPQTKGVPSKKTDPGVFYVHVQSHRTLFPRHKLLEQLTNQPIDACLHTQNVRNLLKTSCKTSRHLLLPFAQGP